MDDMKSLYSPVMEHLREIRRKERSKINQSIFPSMYKRTFV
uniref:Uncharacterized protein n=1 Tax=Anguilla anguilla TaxID=7936 RepID=A0A0E9TLA5_ANGAN